MHDGLTRPNHIPVPHADLSKGKSPRSPVEVRLERFLLGICGLNDVLDAEVLELLTLPYANRRGVSVEECPYFLADKSQPRNQNLHASLMVRYPMGEIVDTYSIQIVSEVVEPSSIERETSRRLFSSGSAVKAINVEFYEFPHPTNENLLTEHQRAELSALLTLEGGFFSLFKARRAASILDDIEKVHLTFLTDGERFIPSYIGLGNQQIFFPGKHALNERFLKFHPFSKSDRYWTEACFSIESKEPCDKDTLELLNSDNHYIAIREGELAKGERRFQGFFRKENSHWVQLSPCFETKESTSRSYRSALERGDHHVDGNLPVLHSPKDLLPFFDSALTRYDRWLALVGHPLFRAHLQPGDTWRVLQRVGPYAGSRYNRKELRTIDNAAHDLGLIVMEQRLRMPLLLLAHAIVSGNFTDLLRGTFQGERVPHLFEKRA